MEEQKIKIHEEAPGETSSKRVMGIIIVAAGVLNSLFVSARGMFSTAAIPNISISVDISKLLIGVGAGLLGITIFEKFSPYINKTNSTQNTIETKTTETGK